MSTIRDVARLAGVSVPTVSRVINGRPNVDESLVKRVRAAIATLDYRPSRAAQRMRTTDSRLVGVILSDITNPFYISVLKGLEHVLSQGETSLLISNADSDSAREDRLIRLVQSEKVDGLVIAPTHEVSPALSTAIGNGLPVVVVDRRMRDVSVDTIYADGLSGTSTAIRHLISLGHRRIGIINGPLHLSSARDRHAGYVEAMTEAGLATDEELTRFGDYRLDSGYALTRDLIGLADPPTAIFVANNEMTIGALNAIHETGRRIPDDVAVVGFDDFAWSMSLNPPLTTVSQSAFETGVQAAQMLLSRIEDGAQPARTVVLDTELVIRASCGSHRTRERRRDPVEPGSPARAASK